MTKMKLELSALEVQSFETADDASARAGTVNGHAKTQVDCLATGAGCGESDNDHCPSIGCSFFRPCDTITPCETQDCYNTVYIDC